MKSHHGPWLDPRPDFGHACFRFSSLQIATVVYQCVFSLHVHTTSSYMKENVWIQCGYSWQWVGHAINKNHRLQENGPPLFWGFSQRFLFYSSLLSCRLPIGQRCIPCSSALTAASHQMSWHHAAWHCELHLPVSTCGWLMCCFIHFLSCLSLIHPRVSLPMLCKSDHCLSLVPILSLFLPSAVGSTHTHRQRWHAITFALQFR